MPVLVAGFLPLDKGKVNEVHEGLAVSGEEGICLPCCGTRNFLFAFAHKISTIATSSPRFITHWVRFGSSPHSLRPEGRGRTNSFLITKKNTNLLVDFFLFGCESGICFSRASRKIVHWTIFSPKQRKTICKKYYLQHT